MLVGNSQLIIITTVVSFAQISPLCSLLAVTVMLQKINEVLTRFHPRWAPQSNRCGSHYRCLPPPDYLLSLPPLYLPLYHSFSLHPGAFLHPPGPFSPVWAALRVNRAKQNRRRSL